MLKMELETRSEKTSREHSQTKFLCMIGRVSILRVSIGPWCLLMSRLPGYLSPPTCDVSLT